MTDDLLNTQNRDMRDKDTHIGEIREPVRLSRSYTKFIKLLRIFLPLVILGLLALVFVWPEMEKPASLIPEEDLLKQSETIQNELIDPRFESLDSENQPFTITASRATQSTLKPELVALESPTADMIVKDGSWVAIKAEEGLYEQQSEKLTLKKNIHIFHDDGYHMNAEELRVNLKEREAFSDLKVSGHGPAGTLNAEGLEAYGEKGLLIFKGPAKLVLNEGFINEN